MTIQYGFDNQIEAPEEGGSGNPLYQGPSIFRVSHKAGTDPNNPDNVKSVLLLDDRPVVAYRHYIKRPFVNGRPTGDWRDRDIRVTCANAGSSKPSPRECLICEAALRHGDDIKRKFTANFSVIVLGAVHTKAGKVYHDLKKMLEVDWAHFNIWKDRVQTAPGGKIAPAIFRVMRPTGDPKRTATWGDVWTMTQQVNPMQQLWQSQAIGQIIQFARQRGNNIEWEQAVRDHVTPYDYSKVIDNYSPEMAETFILYAVAKDYTASAQKGGGAPAMPAAAVPDYSTAPPPPGSGRLPQQPPAAPQAPQYGGVGVGGYVQHTFPPAVQQQVVQAQQQAPPMGPPQVNDPAGAVPPPAAPSAPTPPWEQAPAQAAPAQPQAAPQPPQGAPVPPPPSGVDEYKFDGAPGWSAQFPSAQGQQQPMPAAPPPPQQPVPPPPQGGVALPKIDKPF